MQKKAKGFRTVAEALRSVDRSAARKRRAREKRVAEIAARVPGEGYEPCIVSFIDVLGFQDLLETRHAHDIRDVLVQLREFTAPVEELPTRRMKDARLLSRAFADSVSDAVVRVRVFDTQFNDGAFFHELLDLLHAQVECIGHGVVIRAGVAIGNAHVGLNGKGPVFGPAMVRAYEIETNEAIHPRVVVDQAAYESFLADARLRNQDHELDEELQYVDQLLRVDVDGTRFVDYLGASESEFDDPAGYFLFLQSHAELIHDKLAATAGRVREKFEWLATYHNSVVEGLLEEFANGSRSAEAFRSEYNLDPMSFLQGTIVSA
ncbi:hypothetical protein [Chelativorans intermedius]|uniref:Guanylate cyclase domain-containing protein n=1 Tax=Chelativorans intermedius TaxID=515947 RepID=A0ABV6DBL3_9HYPH|nr:hypothetical protein [Chelativorans intermedius]MCT9000453.1 hypothetical protein [Chelativorans intermedius]